MKDFVGKLLARVGRRTVAITLALLVAVGTLPIVWPSASGNEPACGLEEHTHSEECFELVCTQPEGDIFGSHAHTEGCFAQKLVCGCEEGAEHTSECYESEKICAVEEGEEVLLSSHAHAESCYAAVCGKAEHTHSAECEAAGEETLPEGVEDEEISLLAGTTELSVGGVWDVGDSSKGHENIPFGSSEQATVSHDANQASEQINVRITATYPEDATDLKLKITLKPGLVWLVNGENTIPKTTLDSVSALQNQTTYVKPLGDGSYTYNFKDGITAVTVDIVVEKCFWTNFPSISDAITAEVSCTQDGETVSETASLATLLPQQFSQIIMRRSVSVRTKAGEKTSVRNGLRIGSHLTSAAEKDRYRIYEYIQFTINAPSDVIYLGVHTDDSSEGSPNKKWQLVGEPEVLDDGTTNYTFRTEELYSMYFSSTHYWSFPDSMIGQDVKLVTTDFRWKVYGNTVEETVPAGTVGTATITVVDPDARDEKTEIADISEAQSYISYDDDAPDALYQLTAWSMRNKGTDPSAPKVVELEFDTEKIGVVGLDLLTPRGKKLTTVWFKTEGSDEWQQKEISLPITCSNGPTYFYHTFVRNVDLGLSENTYLSAIKYELDYVDDNGTPDDTSDDFRYGIPAGMATIGYTSVFAPIVGVVKEDFLPGTKAVSTARAYDKVEEGEKILNDTGKIKITSRMGANYENFLSTVNTDVITAEAGDTLTFNTIIKSYWSSTSDRAYISGFHPYPVIYIRDETGEGISNVKLTNAFGTELLSKYPNAVKLTLDHTETVDHNGDGKFAKVYKIDTTGLKSMADFEDRYAACIGCCDLSGNTREMNLTYSVVTSSAYNDSQTVHYTADAVFLTDRDMANRTRRNKRNEISDEFDVDSDGLTTTDKSIVAPSTSYSPGYYIIAARSDVSLSAGVKKSTESTYSTWDGSEAGYIQIIPNENYDVRNSVLNGSGVKTSEEEAKMTYIYIPVPKKGQQWGQANSGVDKDGNALSVFAYDSFLSGAIANPDPDVFTISYGTVNTAAFGAGDSYGTVGQVLKNGSTAWSGSYSDSTNCVRIAVKGMEPSDVAEHFVLTLKADENADNRAVNIFSAIYYEDITNINGNHYAGWYASDRLALQIAIGEISGKVWIDLDGDGIQDEGEKGMAGVTVFAVDEDSKSKQTTTDANGEYSFEKLPVGKYFLSFQHSDMKKYACSPMNVGSNTAIDNDGRIHTATGDGLLTGVQITFAYIPFTDGMGNTSYHAEHMDVGLTPLVEVEYQWSGKIPSAAALPSGKTIASGTKYNAAAVAAVDGYTFDGWYTDSALTSSFANGTAVIKDTVLYGKWSINEYDITYSFVGEAPAGAAAPAADTAEHGTSYTAKDAAAVEGWLFDGWYTDSGCTTKFTSAEVTADIDLYGRWIDNTITVSGTKIWEDVPAELAVPAITIDLMLDGEAVDSVTLASGETEYTFTDAAKYAAVGEPALEYTVQEREVANYIAAYSDPVTDAEGNITIDITNTGDFTYSSLVISNTVAGEDAPADAEFVYTVTLDSALEYPYTGSASGMIKSGDKITLKAGESITVSGLLVGVAFSVEQDEVENFVTTPAGRKIEGAIASTVSLADFTNNFKLPPVGNLTITNKITGNKADTTLKFPFKVEFDADGSYELRIYAAGETIPSSGTGMLGGASIVSAAGARAVTGTIKSGDTIELGHGETAIIYGLPAEISYKVTETDTKGYKMTSTGAAGSIAEDGSTASFINDKSESSGGSANVPDTGDSSSTAIAAAIMSLAAMSMLLCGIAMRKSKEENC